MSLLSFFSDLLCRLFGGGEESSAQDSPVSTAPIPPPPQPVRSMTPEQREYILMGHTPEERATLSLQIDTHEAAGHLKFSLSYPGGYYKIDHGKIVGAGKGSAVPEYD